jgi:hypothetical protein
VEKTILMLTIIGILIGGALMFEKARFVYFRNIFWQNLDHINEIFRQSKNRNSIDVTAERFVYNSFFEYKIRNLTLPIVKEYTENKSYSLFISRYYDRKRKHRITYSILLVFFLIFLIIGFYFFPEQMKGDNI